MQINSGEDGGTVITIIKYITPESEVINISDYAYEAFTYTNVGGAFDVGYQYYNGEISGYEAAGTGLGMLIVGGAGVKGLKGLGNLATFNYRRTGHIFRNAKGHVYPITKSSEGRYINLFENTTIPANIDNSILNGFQKTDPLFTGYSKQYKRGEVWIQRRGGEIINAGVNR